MKIPRLLPVPGVPIGHWKSGRPIYPVLGGSGADEVDDVEDEESTDDEEDEDSDTDEDGVKAEKWAPPSKSEWVKVQASLVRANASAKQRREALAEAEKELQALRDDQASKEAEAERKALLEGHSEEDDTGKKKTAPLLPDGVMTKAQVRQQVAQAVREAEERKTAEYRGMVVNQAARAAMSEAGVQSSNVARLVRLLNLDDVQLDDDGEATEGLSDQIEALRTEMPQLFRAPEPEKAKPRRAPAPRAQPSGRQEVEEENLTSAQQMARQIMGSR